SRAFFLSAAGTAIDRGQVSKTLRTITTATGLRTATVHPPRTRSETQLRRLQAAQLAAIRRSDRRAHRRPLHPSRPPQPGRDLLVSDRDPGADRTGRRPARATVRSTATTALAPTLQAHFTERLIGQRSARPHTIAAYRHTFCLLLRFATDRTGSPPSDLD